MCMNQSSVPAEERAAALLDAEVITLQMRIATLKEKAASLRNGHPAPGGNSGNPLNDMQGTTWTWAGKVAAARSGLLGETPADLGEAR